jgi:hypothetical protein
MGSGVRTLLRHQFRSGRRKTAKVGKLFATTSLCVARINRDRVETREPRCWAIRPDSGDVSALATKRAVGPSNQMCHRSPAHPRACASLAVDRPTGPSLPQRTNGSPACPASSTHFKPCAKPPAVAGREGRQRRGQRSSTKPRQRHQYARDPIRRLRPIQFSPDRKRTHSPCCIPTTKSGAVPHRPLPQFPSPK